MKKYNKIGKDKFKITTEKTEECIITMEEIDNNLKYITEKLEKIKEEKVSLEKQKKEQQELKSKLSKLK